jgi:peroxiredoxin
MSTLFLRRLLPVAGLSLALSAQGTTIVSGHITHPKGTGVAIYYQADPLTRQSLGRVQGKLDAKGDFRLELPALKAATEATFAHGDETTMLFLTPGDNLRLTLDPTKFDETIRYTGTGANANNYFAQAYLKFDDDLVPEPAEQPDNNAGPVANARKFAADQRQQRTAFFQTYAAAHPLPAAARAYARQRLAFNWASNLLFLPAMDQRTGGSMLQSQAPLPADYYDFLAVVRPAQDSALATSNADYFQFLELYARLLPYRGQPATGAGLLTAATEQFGNGRSRDIVLAKYLMGEMKEDVARVTPLLAALRPAFRDSTAAREVRTLYRKRLLLAPGQPAPGITVHDASGKAVRLADYKGQVVYLDFWASWCGPCLAEIPASTTLKKQFEDKDVVFLYISIDDEEANWKKALAKHPLASAHSVHTWAKGWGSTTATGYQVDAIPAYFLIGRDGRIVSSDAPRPSLGDATVAALNAALAK